MNIKKYGQCSSKEAIAELFAGFEDTMIDSCLHEIMGEIFANNQEDAAMANLGDFVFFAGVPSKELVQFESIQNQSHFRILIPQDQAWSECIQQFYGRNAKKIIRYAIKKERDIFDAAKLTQAVCSCPKEYTLKMIGEKEYSLCKAAPWSRDLVSQFEDYSMYQKLGLGAAVFYHGELVAGASSYSSFRGGIEIEIDTREDHRRKGLAYCCAAKLILESLKRGLYPSWDAQNKWSVGLAEKLGYHFDHEYIAYEVL